MMKALLSLFSALALSLCTLAAHAQSIAITNGKVVLNDDAGTILDRATVVIRDGRIITVADNAAVPEGARVIDAAGGWVTPGLFSPFSRLGLVEISAEDATNDTSASKSDLSASLDVADAFNPRAGAIQIAQIEGVTRAALVPSSGNAMIAGQGGFARLDGSWDSVYRDRAFVYIEFGERGASLAGGSRAASWAYFRAALADARGFPAQFMAHVEGDVIRRADAEALRAYIRGQGPILVRADRASDILRLIEFAGENSDVQFVLVGGTEAFKVAPQLAAARIPVLFDPMNNLPSSLEMVAARLDAANYLSKAGVRFAFTTETAADGDRFNLRLMPQHAGNAVAHGLPWSEGFKAISRYPAEIHGQGDVLGRLAIGYIADVVVWDGDPLEVTSAPRAVLIDGKVQPMTSRQVKLAQRYMNIPEPGRRSTGYIKPQ
jgi:imidazolonepropionase-like amidohydrolase